MKKLFAATVSAAALYGASAVAADLPIKAPAYKASVTAPYNWNGFYVGGLVGYGWGTSRHRDGSGSGLTVDSEGWNGGVTLGYNWQLANWVFGVEGDWSGADIKGSSKSIPGFGCGVSTCDTNIKSSETIRGRVGHAFDRFLPYVTAGVAWTQLEASIGRFANSTTKSSFTAGGGFEYAFLPNWSAKLEYLHVSDLGDFLYASNVCVAPGCSVTKVRQDEIRLGMNYKFGGM